MTLIDQYRVLHKHPKVFTGMSCLANAYTILRLIKHYHAETLLDYGCGKGDQYREPYCVQRWWGVQPAMYDPAVPGHDTLPDGEFDGVFCVDVLEHIEEPDIPATLDVLFSKARRFLFVTVCPRESTRLLPDGRNCHITIRDEDWWSREIKSAHRRSRKNLKVKMAVTR